MACKILILFGSLIQVSSRLPPNGPVGAHAESKPSCHQSRQKKFMLTGGTPAASGGPRQSAETGIARAETLGPDGGQQTWKPGPGGAEGPTDAKESAHNLFPLGMLKPGKGAGARGGGPRGMVAEVGRPGAGARHAAQPAPRTAAGGRAIRGAASTIAQHGTLSDNKDTRLGGGQDNGELSDVAQKYGSH